MQQFIKQSEIAAPPNAVFAWHERPDAIERLTPPWERVEALERASGLQTGARVVFYEAPMGFLASVSIALIAGISLAR